MTILFALFGWAWYWHLLMVPVYFFVIFCWVAGIGLVLSAFDALWHTATSEAWNITIWWRNRKGRGE